MTDSKVSRRISDRGSIDLLQVFCLALWMTCLGVGLLGLLLRYPMPALRAQKPARVTAVAVQVADVRIADEPLPGDEGSPAAQAGAPVAVTSVTSVTSAPPALPALALPAPSIAFAMPVTAPAQIVDARRADGGPRPRQDASTSGARSTGVEHLTFGVGQGAQPKPDYPRDALVAGEQGSVGLRIDVDENGRVIQVRVADPSRWPLLNQAAVQKAREAWRFSTGAARTIEITVRFEIH